MKNIKKILVPTDFSDTAASAFRFASWFADQHEAEIELLHIVVPNVEAMDAPYLAVNTIQQRLEAAKEIIQAFTEANLTAVTTAHKLHHAPKVKSNLRIGSPAHLITEVTNEENVDLVIMGTQGEHS
ncbi:MAG: universal stress protein, partial [Bacteroidota bacterium]